MVLYASSQDRHSAACLLRLLNSDFMFGLSVLTSSPRRRVWHGSPSHDRMCVRDYLDRTFRYKWIGRASSVARPTKSPDLSSLHFVPLVCHEEPFIRHSRQFWNRPSWMNIHCCCNDPWNARYFRTCPPIMSGRCRDYMLVYSPILESSVMLLFLIFDLLMLFV